MPIPIIDLFAGPGGLAEGFSSLTDEHDQRVFDIKLSIEKDEHAHQTLALRSFLRQFPVGHFPVEYYTFLEGQINLQNLYKQYPHEYSEALKEAWRATLGETSEIEIDRRISDGIKDNQNWVLIGGPPCQAYSLAGRSRVGGISEKDHRVHLYKEYLRIIARHQPAVFVMENVKGLLSAELNGEKIFHKILSDLKDPSSVFPEYESSSYRIYSLVKNNIRSDRDYLIKSEEYGVPQKRHRVILLGVREDIPVIPGTLNKKKKNSLRSVIGNLPAIRSSVYREFTHSDTISKDGNPVKKRNYRNLTDSFDLWSEKINGFRMDLMRKFMARKHEIKFEPVYPESTGTEYARSDPAPLPASHLLSNWYNDKNLRGIIQHESRGHLVQDLNRYLFAAIYTGHFQKFPRMEDYLKYGEDLLPDHANAQSGKFNDRFRVQLPNEPATTITSHISKDGHYFIHYDPSQCRSLTVREAARIQTFPDNYFFCGSRTQQFHQVGNAVPPFLAFQIASVVESVVVPEKASLSQEPLLL